MARTNNKDKQNKPKIDINLTVETLNLMLDFCFCEKSLVNARSILNLKNLIDRVTFNDDLHENRLKFNILKTTLHLQAERHLFQAPIIIEELHKKFPDDIIFIDAFIEHVRKNQASDNDIHYLSEYVEERLSYLYLYENKERLKAAINQLEESNNLVAINNSFEDIISNLYRDLQNSKAVKKDSATDFCIGGVSQSTNKNLATMVKKTIDDMNKPSNFIKTGVQAFNEMLGGGLENGRAYLVYAPPKSWKSGLLMNIAIWAAKYNEFAIDDPDLTPCILYVTMENTSKETINRLFTHITGQKINKYNYKDERDAYNEATKAIQEYIVGKRNISFEIRYRKNRSISTNDLDAMIDELALEGKKVVLIIQDLIIGPLYSNVYRKIL